MAPAAPRPRLAQGSSGSCSPVSGLPALRMRGGQHAPSPPLRLRTWLTGSAEQKALLARTTASRFYLLRAHLKGAPVPSRILPPLQDVPRLLLAGRRRPNPLPLDPRTVPRPPAASRAAPLGTAARRRRLQPAAPPLPASPRLGSKALRLRGGRGKAW